MCQTPRLSQYIFKRGAEIKPESAVFQLEMFRLRLLPGSLSAKGRDG